MDKSNAIMTIIQKNVQGNEDDKTRRMEKYKKLTCLKYREIMMNIIPDKMER